MKRIEISQRRQEIVNAVKWSWYNEIGYSPHIYQIWMHKSLARYRTSCAGRRGGKTEWAGHEGSAYMVAGPFRVWIVAPSYDLGYKEFRVIQQDLSHEANHYNIERFLKNRQAGQLYMRLSNGAECEVISIDKPKKSGHGEEVDLVILSECGLMDNIGGEDGVWNKTLVGAMSSRRAEVVTPTTPQGQDDFLFPMFMKGLIPDSIYSKFQLADGRELDLIKYYDYTGGHDPEYFSLQWPAWANPYGYLEDPQKQFNDLPLRIFLEQICGFFVRWSGSIWLTDFCYDPNKHLIEPFFVPNWWRRIEIIDPGYSGLFAWLAALVDGEGKVYIVDEYSANRTLYKEHVAEIKRRRKTFYNKYVLEGEYDSEKFIPVYVDPEDPQCIAELNKLGLHCISADNDVISGFQAGAFRFNNESLHIWNTCKNIDASLRNHEWAKQKHAGAKAREANDKWKHYSDCVRYLNTSNLTPSEKSVAYDENQETLADIIRASRSLPKNVLDMTIDEWERVHAAYR